jgi:hypothetical protein
MTTSSKRLLTASVANLVSNTLGILLALQHNLVSDLGGTFHGHDVLHDYLTTTRTALSAPVPFMLIQLVLTMLLLRTDRWRQVGAAGLTFFGLLYTLAQGGEHILFRLLTPSGSDALQALVFFINVGSAVAMLVFGIFAWKEVRTFRLDAGQNV